MVLLSQFNILYFLGCGAGYFSTYPDPSSCECEIYPVDTYTDNDYADTCTPCPEGQFTAGEGSTHCKTSKYIHFLVNIPLKSLLFAVLALN